MYQGDTVAQGKIVTAEMCAVDAIYSSRAFVISSDRSFAWTSNCGTKWNGSVIKGSEVIFDVEFLNQDTGWVAGCCGRVWQTMDGGITWSAFESGLNSDITRVNVLHNEKVVYAMGTNNALLRLDLVTDAKELESELPKNFHLDQNYPNPFNPKTTITYTLPENSRVLLKVYDVLGQVVGILVDGDEKAGNKFMNFDARNLPSGVYYYRLTAGKFSEIKKMLLVR